VKMAGEYADAFDMIGMLVGDDYRADIFRGDTGLRHAHQQVFQTETLVNQEPLLMLADKSAIAFTAAA